MVLRLKVKYICYFLVCICSVLSWTLNAPLCFATKINTPIYYDNSYATKIVPTNGVLQAGISETKDLPSELYGMWSVYSSITDTNDYSSFNNKGEDVWSFSKDRDVITLTNPISGASASITVDEVQGKTAVFSRQTITHSYKEIETAKITVDGDFFTGTDKIIVENFNRSKNIHTSIVEYKLRGTRLSGSTLNNIFGK